MVIVSPDCELYRTNSFSPGDLAAIIVSPIDVPPEYNLAIIVNKSRKIDDIGGEGFFKTNYVGFAAFEQLSNVNIVELSIILEKPIRKFEWFLQSDAPGTETTFLLGKELSIWCVVKIYRIRVREHKFNLPQGIVYPWLLSQQLVEVTVCHCSPIDGIHRNEHITAIRLDFKTLFSFCR